MPEDKKDAPAPKAAVLPPVPARPVAPGEPDPQAMKSKETVPGGLYVDTAGHYVNANGDHVDKDGKKVDKPVRADGKPTADDEQG
jgi:hypothetical protein